MADKKVSELDTITGADTASDDFFLIVDSSGSVSKKISRDELNNAIEIDVLNTVDINGGTIDGTTIGGSSAAVGTFTTVNATTLDTTNIEVTNIKAKDGTAAGSIADSTGVVTLASSVLTDTDINGGTVDGADITVGSGKTLNVSAGTLTLADNQISGDKIDGGTISSFASTGIDDNASSTAITIDSSQRVGISATSPSSRLSLGDSTVSSSNTITFGKRVTSSQSNLPLIGHDSSDGAASDLGICATSSTGKINFYTGNDASGFGTGSNDKRMEIDHKGQVAISGSSTSVDTAPSTNGLQLYYESDTGIATIAPASSGGTTSMMFRTNSSAGTSAESFTINSSQNIVMAAGHGIDFANNAHASGMSSELFDDYEEGTFTGTLDGQDSSPSSTITQTGRYTKIGRLVHATIAFEAVNTTGASGDVEITGWPFSAAGRSSVTLITSGVVSSFQTINVASDTANIAPFFETATKLIFLETRNSASSWVISEHTAGTNRYLYIAVVYEAA